MVQRELTDEQWLRIAPHLPEHPRSPKGGRTPAPARACFEGLLWILRTGARWKDMPDCFPSGPTCWRRLRDWDECGAWEAAWIAFVSWRLRRGVAHVLGLILFFWGTVLAAEQLLPRIGYAVVEAI